MRERGQSVGIASPPGESSLCRMLKGDSTESKRYALTAVWSLYVWLAALLAARPDDLRVAMAMTELEDQMFPLFRELRADRPTEGTSS